MKSLLPMARVSDGFWERMNGNYMLIQAKYSPEELFYLMGQAPEVYLEEGGMTTIVSQNQNQEEQKMRLEMAYNLFNRLVMADSNRFTYQDTVYVQSMLEKLGIRNVSEFMKQLYEIQEDIRNVKQLSNIYETNKVFLRAMVQNVKEDERQEAQEGGNLLSVNEKAAADSNHLSITEKAAADSNYFSVNEEMHADSNHLSITEKAAADSSHFSVNEEMSAGSNRFSINEKVSADSSHFSVSEEISADSSHLSVSEEISADSNHLSIKEEMSADSNRFSVDEKIVTNSNRFSVDEKMAANKVFPVYWIHNEIFRRLQSADIYNMVAAFQKDALHYAGWIRSQETAIAEQVRTSKALKLKMLENHVLMEEGSLMDQRVSIYEEGAKKGDSRKGEIIHELAGAALLNISEGLCQICASRMQEDRENWYRFQGDFRQILENTMERFQAYHFQRISLGNLEISGQYQKLVNEFRSQEINQLNRAITASQSQPDRIRLKEERAALTAFSQRGRADIERNELHLRETEAEPGNTRHLRETEAEPGNTRHLRETEAEPGNALMHHVTGLDEVHVLEEINQISRALEDNTQDFQEKEEQTRILQREVHRLNEENRRKLEETRLNEENRRKLEEAKLNEENRRKLEETRLNEENRRKLEETRLNEENRRKLEESERIKETAVKTFPAQTAKERTRKEMLLLLEHPELSGSYPGGGLSERKALDGISGRQMESVTEEAKALSQESKFHNMDVQYQKAAGFYEKIHRELAAYLSYLESEKKIRETERILHVKEAPEGKQNLKTDAGNPEAVSRKLAILQNSLKELEKNLWAEKNIKEQIKEKGEPQKAYAKTLGQIYQIISQYQAEENMQPEKVLEMKAHREILLETLHTSQARMQSEIDRQDKTAQYLKLLQKSFREFLHFRQEAARTLLKQLTMENLKENVQEAEQKTAQTLLEKLETGESREHISEIKRETAQALLKELIPENLKEDAQREEEGIRALQMLAGRTADSHGFLGQAGNFRYFSYQNIARQGGREQKASPEINLRFYHKEPQIVTVEIGKGKPGESMQIRQGERTLRKQNQAQTIPVRQQVYTQAESLEKKNAENITELIQRGMQRQINSISEQVYHKLEKKLSNDRKRRGY